MTKNDPSIPSHPHVMEGTEERKLLTGPASRSSELWRVIRIALEFIQGFRALHFVGPCVTVFGSARFDEDHPYYALARDIGSHLAEMGFTVMTGGGPGIMEAANRGAKDVGGRSIGCNIELPEEQYTNPYLDRWVTFDHFYVRKVMLVKYSYAFVAMPGGIGTMDEVFETATLIQTGKIKDFAIIMVGTDYWGPLLDFMRDTLVVQETISETDLDHIHLVDSADEVVSLLRNAAIERFGLEYREKPPKRRWFFFER
ncbi:MAG TPA: TIGR00730 family Rossman fold protein [Dehalococcoidia bacterium]|nr:TIGR00730 family Rossman fold protein [Dehalococcoidia bacterium]